MKKYGTLETWILPILMISCFIMILTLIFKEITQSNINTQPAKDNAIQAFKTTNRAKITYFVNCIENQKWFTELKTTLKAREGYAGCKYKHKGKEYVGYGHLLLKGESINNIDINEADSILEQDIKKAFYEVQRINKNNLKSDIYSVFTSGKVKRK